MYCSGEMLPGVPHTVHSIGATHFSIALLSQITKVLKEELHPVNKNITKKKQKKVYKYCSC